MVKNLPQDMTCHDIPKQFPLLQQICTLIYISRTNKRSLVHVQGGTIQQHCVINKLNLQGNFKLHLLFTHSFCALMTWLEQRQQFHRSSDFNHFQKANQLKRPVHNVLLSKWLFQKRERQGLVGSLCNRPTCRTRLRSRTTASSQERAILLVAARRIHVYFATCGCRYSLRTRPTTR